MQKQHYISQVLLRNFSPEGKEGLINIIIKPDKELLNQSIAKHAASEFNYNTLSNKGEENNILEQLASKLESEVGRVFKRMKESNYNISDEDMSILLYFGSFLFVNVPHSRDNFERFQKSVAEKILDLLSNDLALLKNTLAKTDIPNRENIDVKALADSYLNGKIKVNIAKNDIILTCVKQVDTVFNIISKMYWSFYIVKDNGIFITADIPLIPVKKEGFNDPIGPGFGNADLVVFPLTKRVCIVGQWIGPANNLEVNGDYANGVNISMMKYSSQLYLSITQNELVDQFNRY